MRLDKRDSRIISMLDTNARTTNTRIAKTIRLSKPSVERRIAKLEREGIISFFYAVINFTRMGYSQYKLYFKLQNADIEAEEQILRYWTAQQNAVWVARLRGKWDVAVSVLAKTNYEFGKVLGEFLGKHGQFILDKALLLTEYSPVYFKGSRNEPFVYGLPGPEYEPDEIEERILSELSVRARDSIVEIARRTGMSKDVVLYRMRKMKKDGIIAGQRVWLNLGKLGIRHDKIMLSTHNLSRERESALREYVKASEHTTQFLKLIGPWDVEIECETKNGDELHKILVELRHRFSDVIRDYDVISIHETLKYDYFPFYHNQFK
ncbi:MAG: winged helix-turn-helix transcriptional regulator [Candidatus Woesearchaeota archaeon]